MRAFPLRHIPNFKTTAATDESDLAFQTQLLAKIFGQDEPALFVRCAVFGAGVQLAGEDATISRRNARLGLGLRAHAGKLLVRHDQQELLIDIGEQDELFALPATPS